MAITYLERLDILREALAVQGGSVEDAWALVEDTAYIMGASQTDVKLLRETLAEIVTNPKPIRYERTEIMSLGIERFARLGLNSVNRTAQNR